MALLVPDESLPHFGQLSFELGTAKRDIVHLGLSVPSNKVFTSDGASLGSCDVNCRLIAIQQCLNFELLQVNVAS